MSSATASPRRGTPSRILRAADVNAGRFWAFVDVGGADECWPWLGTVAPNGYGLFRIGGRRGLGKFGAHRVAFALDRGAAPAELVCHSCDNRPCCNPAHLFAGSSAVNIVDAIEKGRMVERWRPRAVA